jgi:hypothetical protein
MLIGSSAGLLFSDASIMLQGFAIAGGVSTSGRRGLGLAAAGGGPGGGRTSVGGGNGATCWLMAGGGLAGVSGGGLARLGAGDGPGAIIPGLACGRSGSWPGGGASDDG